MCDQRQQTVALPKVANSLAVDLMGLFCLPQLNKGRLHLVTTILGFIAGS
jgi:hypothetical protein